MRCMGTGGAGSARAARTGVRRGVGPIGASLALVIGCGHTGLGEAQRGSSGLTVSTETTTLGENGRARCALAPDDRGLPVLDLRVDSECPSNGPVSVSIDLETRDLRPHLTRTLPQKLEVLPAHNDFPVEGLVYPNEGSLVRTTVSAPCTDRVLEVAAVALCRYHKP